MAKSKNESTGDAADTAGAAGEAGAAAREGITLSFHWPEMSRSDRIAFMMLRLRLRTAEAAWEAICGRGKFADEARDVMREAGATELPPHGEAPATPPPEPSPHERNVLRLVQHAEATGYEVSLETIERFCRGEHVDPPATFRWLMDAKTALKFSITIRVPRGANYARNLQVDSVHFLPPPPEPDPSPSVVEECVASGKHGQGFPPIESSGSVLRYTCCRARYVETKSVARPIVRR